MRLDADVYVLRHQDDAAIGMHLLQVYDDGNDLVIGLAAGERGRERGRDRLGLNEQPPARRAAAARLEWNAGAQIAGADRAGRGDQLVQIARGLARVARNLGPAL